MKVDCLVKQQVKVNWEEIGLEGQGRGYEGKGRHRKEGKGLKGMDGEKKGYRKQLGVTGRDEKVCDRKGRKKNGIVRWRKEEKGREIMKGNRK